MKLTVALLLTLFTTFGFGQENCQDLKDDCDFYSCLEQKMHCGEDNYLQSIGRKYCLKYYNHYDGFSKRGQNFIDGTFNCLTDKLLEKSHHKYCPRLKHLAVNDHVNCYFKNGYCNLSVGDKLKVLNVIKSSFVHSEIVEAGIQLINKCLLDRF